MSHPLCKNVCQFCNNCIEEDMQTGEEIPEEDYEYTVNELSDADVDMIADKYYAENVYKEQRS